LEQNKPNYRPCGSSMKDVKTLVQLIKEAA